MEIFRVYAVQSRRLPSSWKNMLDSSDAEVCLDVPLERHCVLRCGKRRFNRAGVHLKDGNEL